MTSLVLISALVASYIICNVQGDVQDEACFTSDGQQGKCVGSDSCPHLEHMEYVGNSGCEGPEEDILCCPPPNNDQKPSGVCTNTAAAPDPRSGCCGLESRDNDKTVGKSKGREAAAVDQFPWTVIIEYVKDDKPTKNLCGGVLISGKYVLTAAHCAAGPVLNFGTPQNVHLGEYDTSNDGPDCVETAGGGQDCTEGVTVIPIEEVIVHPEYNPISKLKRHDIALIRLKSIAPYTDYIRPICLPQTDVTANPPKNPLTFFVVGWGSLDNTQGRSNIKTYVDLPYKTIEECQPAYSGQGRNVTLWNNQLCAGGVEGKDSCKGDGGSPLMYEHDKIHELVGIVSFGPSVCGTKDVPGVYTKVYEYNTWIRSNIKP